MAATPGPPTPGGRGVGTSIAPTEHFSHPNQDDLKPDRKTWRAVLSLWGLRVAEHVAAGCDGEWPEWNTLAGRCCRAISDRIVIGGPRFALPDVV
eukprot:7161931-Prymnesium_polylepis.1